MGKSYTKEECIALLQGKQEQIGKERMPCRSDFSEAEVVAIKAHLGPWPRALEAAGLKEASGEDRRQKNRQRRVETKRERRAAQRSADAQEPSE